MQGSIIITYAHVGLVYSGYFCTFLTELTSSSHIASGTYYTVWMFQRAHKVSGTGLRCCIPRTPGMGKGYGFSTAHSKRCQVRECFFHKTHRSVYHTRLAKMSFDEIRGLLQLGVFPSVKRVMLDFSWRPKNRSNFSGQNGISKQAL